MPHKIAIITSRDFYSDDQDYNYDSTHTKIVESITDWKEITDDEFLALKSNSSRLGFTVIEQPINIDAFVKKTVDDYLAFTKAETKRLAEEKVAREAAALARKFKKELKDRDSKLKMFQKLKIELEGEIT